MPTSFSDHYQRGFARPVRYRRGEGVNVWAAKLNECADKFDAMDLPEEAAAVLRDLFEEFGQLYRDLSDM